LGFLSHALFWLHQNHTHLVRLESSGTLTLNTCLGGSGKDNGKSIAVNGSKNVDVTGTSTANWSSPVRS
jgi:hypothetical protein